MTAPIRQHNQAVALMEVVLALVLLAAFMGVVVGGFGASTRSLHRLELQARARDLAVTLLSQVQLGDLPPDAAGPEEYDSELRPDLSGWTWELIAEDAQPPIEGIQVKNLRAVIANESENYAYELGYLWTQAQDAEATEVSGG